MRHHAQCPSNPFATFACARATVLYAIPDNLDCLLGSRQSTKYAGGLSRGGAPREPDKAQAPQLWKSCCMRALVGLPKHWVGLGLQVQGAAVLSLVPNCCGPSQRRSAWQTLDGPATSAELGITDVVHQQATTTP